jgi:aminoacrylate hydrolase
VATAQVNGIEIAYEEAGDGPPLLLLTGLGGAGRAWGSHRERFAADFRTIVPDHRGAGGSSKPADGYTIDAHAADMAELLRHLGTGPAHVVGSSTGGAIGQVMALDHPDVVRSLVLVSSWAGPDEYFRREFEVRRQVLETSGMAAYLQTSAVFLFAPSYTAAHADHLERWIAAAGSGDPDPAIVGKRIDMIVSHDARARLRSIDVPTLVVVGNEDICTPPHLSKELAARIPAAELAVLPGGHLIHDERPDGFHDTVREWALRH